MAAKEVPAHVMRRRLLETVNDPAHGERTNSPEFRRSKKRLRADGHYTCWICGTAKNIQIHHYGSEWMFGTITDFGKLKTFCEEWDCYGYGRVLKNQPMTSTEDIRNCMALCREHHLSGPADGAANGVHDITFSAWVSQKLVKDGMVTVPADDDPLDGR